MASILITDFYDKDFIDELVKSGFIIFTGTKKDQYYPEVFQIRATIPGISHKKLWKLCMKIRDQMQEEYSKRFHQYVMKHKDD